MFIIQMYFGASGYLALYVKIKITCYLFFAKLGRQAFFKRSQ